MTTMLRDVIDIPEQATQATFVMGLAEGVADKKRTLSQYVVTPQLVECFDKALGLVSAGVKDGRSQAAFLHGSFGSGKSHFMAVLYQLLRNDPDAREIPELAPVIAKSDKTLQKKNLLPLTFHLIGAKSLEHAILGGYVKQIRRLHPECTLPAVYPSDKLLSNADQLRTTMGDESFFDALNKARKPTSGKLGNLGLAAGQTAKWDAATYDSARQVADDDKQRGQLVSDLTATLLPAFASNERFVDLDPGLTAIAQHAADLGYDGLVLFLDELILWLASNLGDQAFVSNEAAKLANLVEAQDAGRAIPLISYVARQRDLVEFLGDHVPGAQRAAFGKVLSWSQGRFGDIRLADRNLPLIAERRLLAPKTPEAKATIDAAFAEIDRRPDVWDVLLSGGQAGGETTGSDQEAFRRTYPFSPALVATLVTLSQALQRERTALLVMLTLLVEGRNRLEVTDIIPVGDLYDVIVAQEVDAVTPELKHQFDQARRLYNDRIQPALLEMNQLDLDAVSMLPSEHIYRTHDRLAKTLLISALAPEVPALSGLTASRLAALNHGTINEYMPGEASVLALQVVKQLAANVGEIRVGEGQDPLLSVELTDVDPELIIENARAVDNDGNRRRALRELVWQSLGVTEQNTLDDVQSESLVWRGRKALVDMVFGNVRDPDELPDRVFLAERDRWKVVIDYPFDVEGMTPSSDLARVDAIRSDGVESQTLFWIPSFLTGPRMRDLGVYVILNHILDEKTDRFDQYASHLNAVDRGQAKSLLKQRRDTLRDLLLQCIKQAYGVAKAEPSDVDTSTAPPSNFLTLAPGFKPQPPVGHTLGNAFTNLVHQALTWSYPAHPDFQPSDELIKPGELKKVLGYCERAYEAPAHRVEVESGDRSLLRRVCGPLEIGQVAEAHFVLNPQSFPWSQRLMQPAAQEGYSDHYPVSELLGYLDQPQTRGLSAPVAGLVLRVFAMLNDLAWAEQGASVPTPDPERVTGSLELRRAKLPPEDIWLAARDCGREVFEVNSSELRSTTTVSRLASMVREEANSGAAHVRALEQRLSDHKADLGVDKGDADRWATAAAVRTLVDAVVQESSDLELIQLLAVQQWPTSAPAAGRSFATAGEVKNALTNTKWSIIRPLRGISDDRADRAKAALADLTDTARRDELSASLASALKAMEDLAAGLLAEVSPTKPPKPTQGSSGQQIGTVGGLAAMLDAIRGAIEAGDDNESDRLEINWRVGE